MCQRRQAKSHLRVRRRGQLKVCLLGHAAGRYILEVRSGSFVQSFSEVRQKLFGSVGGTHRSLSVCSGPCGCDSQEPSVLQDSDIRRECKGAFRSHRWEIGLDFAVLRGGCCLKCLGFVFWVFALVFVFLVVLAMC